MRYLATGGSRFDPEIMRDFHDLGIDILQALGLTETTAAIFVNSPKDNVIGSCGTAMKGVEGKIIDPQPQEEGPPVGELAVRGAVVMKGYWNRPDATAAVLRDGWFLTGDLGYFDSAGHLFLTGRKKEVIVLSNGKNVYPEEIEAHYLKSPYIKEIAVMGLEGKPGEGGDRLHAVIVPNFDVLRQRENCQRERSDPLRHRRPVGADCLHQAHWQLRNLAGRSAAHHHAQDQALRSGEASQGESVQKGRRRFRSAGGEAAD